MQTQSSTKIFTKIAHIMVRTVQKCRLQLLIVGQVLSRTMYFVHYPTRPDPILKNPTRWALIARFWDLGQISFVFGWTARFGKFLYPDRMKWNDSNLIARKYQSTSAVNIRSYRRIILSTNMVWQGNGTWKGHLSLYLDNLLSPKVAKILKSYVAYYYHRNEA